VESAAHAWLKATGWLIADISHDGTIDAMNWVLDDMFVNRPSRCGADRAE
jgi:hypothetical protein